MPIIANLLKPRGRAKRKFFADAVAGPSSYAAGGFTVSTGLSTIENLVVQVRPQDGRGDGIVVGIEYSVSGGDITIVVDDLDTTAATPAWAEVAGGTDLSNLTFDVLAVGY